MPSIFLFTGENAYALQQELQRWKRGFMEKHGEENLSQFNGKKVQPTALLDEIAIAPFIAEKRLVIISGIPKMEKEEVQRIEQIIHPQVLLAFVESKPDKRLSATKELLACAEIKQFDPLTRPALQQWMQSELQKEGATMESPAQKLLLDLVGEDQNTIAHEVQKLALFASDRTITTDDVELLVLPGGEQVVWRLMDLLALQKTDEALSYAKCLLDRGESPHALWNRLLWMMNNLVAVSAAVQDGRSNPGELSKSLGIPFPSVRSLLPLARSIDPSHVQRLAEEMADTEVGLKTGAFRSTVEAPEELLALIDRCVLRFS